MKEDERFVFKGLIFENKESYEDFFDIDQGITNFYHNSKYSLDYERFILLAFNGLMLKFDNIEKKLKIEEIEKGSLEKNFKYVFLLLRSKNKSGLDSNKFRKNEKDLLKKFNEVVKIIFKND